MAMSDEQKILRTMLRRRVHKGSGTLTPSEIMRHAHISADALKTALERLEADGTIQHIHGFVHANQIGRPTNYYYPTCTLKADEDGTVRPTSTPNPDVQHITAEIIPSQVDDSDAYSLTTLAPRAEFSYLDASRRIVAAYEDPDVDWRLTVADAVASAVKWSLVTVHRGNSTKRSDLQDDIFAMDCFTFEADVKAVAMKAFFRLTLPWYPEFWAINGCRQRFDSNRERMVLTRRTRDLSMGEGRFVNAADTPLLETALSSGGHEHRAAYAMAINWMDTPNSDGSFSEQALHYVGHSTDKFLYGWVWDSEVLEEIQPEPNFAQLIASAMPADIWTDDIDPEAMRKIINAEGASILWLMPNRALDRHSDGSLVEPRFENEPMWLSDPKAHARLFRSLQDNKGLRLTIEQRRFVHEQLGS